MAEAVLLPKLGQTVEESTIVKWHKSVGDTVAKGDILFEMETDKAVLEVESFYEGTLLKILAGDGDTFPVLTTVAYIGKPGEVVPDATATPPAVTAAPVLETKAPEKKAEDAKPAAPKQSAPVVQPVAVQTASRPAPAKVEAVKPSQASRLMISPRAKALAKSKAINPSRIRGAGPEGRIVTKDVTDYLTSHGYDDLKISPAAKRLAVNNEIDILTVKGTGINGRIMIEDVKRSVSEKPKAMSKMRQIISSRLTESFRDIPHFYVTVSVDMTDLMAYRQELKDKGAVYSVTDFILESVVMSLQEYPIVNSSTDGRTSSWRGSVELGLAVGLDDGLVVPVIHDAGSLSLMELHDVAKDLAERARTGKLKPDEMSGSSFTVSNMGMFDVDNFNAIINPGESAILAVASTRKMPAVVNNEIKVRSIMKITLSVDHRLVDGVVGAEFANAVKSKLEDVELWKMLV